MFIRKYVIILRQSKQDVYINIIYIADVTITQFADSTINKMFFLLITEKKKSARMSYQFHSKIVNFSRQMIKINEIISNKFLMDPFKNTLSYYLFTQFF